MLSCFVDSSLLYAFWAFPHTSLRLGCFAINHLEILSALLSWKSEGYVGCTTLIPAVGNNLCFCLLNPMSIKIEHLQLFKPFVNPQKLISIFCRCFQMTYTSVILLMMQSLSGLFSCEFISMFDIHCILYIHFFANSFCELHWKLLTSWKKRRKARF